MSAPVALLCAPAGTATISAVAIKIALTSLCAVMSSHLQTSKHVLRPNHSVLCKTDACPVHSVVATAKSFRYTHIWTPGTALVQSSAVKPVMIGGHTLLNASGQASLNGGGSRRVGPGWRRRTCRCSVDDDDGYGRRSRDRATVHRARAGGLRHGAHHRQRAGSRASRSGDQAADARCGCDRTA